MTSYFEAFSAFLEKNPLYTKVTRAPPLEEKLLPLLKTHELEALDLPVFLRPKILRGLPRLFDPTHREVSRIKPAFSDLTVLKRHWIDKAILYLYQLFAPPCKGSIVLITFAFPDGRGDLNTSAYTENYLKQAFPHLKISSFLFVHHSFPCENIRRTLLYSQNPKQLVIHEAFSKEDLKKLKQAALILEIPTAFPGTLNLKKSYPRTSFERLGEHGFIESAPFHPAVSRCMGLHFLEKGIFIKEKISSSFDQLKDARLSSYLGKNRFNFAYTKTARGTSLYVMTLLYAKQEDPKDLDICLFHFPYRIDFSRKNLGVFKGVKEFILLKKNEVQTLKIHKTGKRVRLIFCEQLSHTDVLHLTGLSEDLIGCTGDQSVLEAISTGTPFFYDPPPFKRLFLKDLQLMAENDLKQYPSLARFFRLCLKNPHLPLPEPDAGFVSEDALGCMDDRVSLEEDTDEKIAEALGDLLKKKELKEGFTALQEVLKRDHALEPLLKGLVCRSLCHRTRNDIAELEKTLNEQFVLGEISGGDLLFRLRKALIDLSNPIFIPNIHLLHKTSGL